MWEKSNISKAKGRNNTEKMGRNSTDQYLLSFEVMESA